MRKGCADHMIQTQNCYFLVGQMSASVSETMMIFGRKQESTEKTHLLITEQGQPKSNDDKHSEKLPSKRTLGTFDGVFAPVSLSMLTPVFFLRVGYIVGNAGVLESVLQYALAYAIVAATGLSICAIATNGTVEGGGTYYMISRSLGMEFGGAVGILGWFACGVASTLYIVACTEGIVSNFGPHGTIAHLLPDSPSWHLVYCTVLNLLNLSVCLIGAKMFGRTTVGIFTMVSICIFATMASFFSDYTYTDEYVFNMTDCKSTAHNGSWINCTQTSEGKFTGLLASSPELIAKNFMSNLEPRFEYDCSTKPGRTPSKVDFSIVFGVLFSGITGIMTGAGMSGELISPGKNIPRGTMGACFFTLCVLSMTSLLTAITCNPALILHDCVYMSHFSFWTPIVAIGTFLATISASLNNLIASSRVLEAVAKDMMFGPLLSFVPKGTCRNNPILAVAMTWIIVEAFLFAGGLNTISQFASVLLLLSYAGINLACLLMELSAAPNFRPSFKYFSWFTSLIGLIGTTVMMFFVSPLFSGITIFLCLLIIFGLHFFSPIRDENWGSISQALIFHQVRKYLLVLDPRKDHIKFWRPQVLLLVANPRTSCSLMDFANSLKKSGIYIIGHVYDNQLKIMDQDPCVDQREHWLSLVDHLDIKAFAELTMASSLREGVQHLARITGIGAMKPNTIIMGFWDDSEPADDFKSPYSPYATEQFEGIFPPARVNDDNYIMSMAPKRVNKKEYVGIVCDLLKMQKNVCLSRHFQLLNKDTMFQSGKKSIFGKQSMKRRFLDVWLFDFFAPGEIQMDDTSSMFLLQLACIVNMVPSWKQAKIRVFSSVSDGSSASIVDKNTKVSHMLELLRINAESHVLEWPHGKVSFYGTGQVAPTEYEGANAYPDYKKTDTDYLDEACQLVRGRSRETAVIFLYMPKPPKDEDLHEAYLMGLTRLTAHWPPTMIARGLSQVTTTTL